MLSDQILIAESLAEQRKQLEHFAELGRLSASMLHEISNPLTAALLYLEQHDSDSPVDVKFLKRNMLILKQYVEAARQQIRNESTANDFYTRQQLAQVRHILIPLARQRNVRLIINKSPNFKIFGDPVKFQQILANLIINAIDSYDSSDNALQKQVTVSMKSHNQWVIIKVKDRGSGITSDHLSLIFEPFYSTKNISGHGLGIGLATVKRYVEEDFSGDIKVTSTINQGTVFTAKLRITPLYL